jgi:hypothetical protein
MFLPYRANCPVFKICCHSNLQKRNYRNRLRGDPGSERVKVGLKITPEMPDTLVVTAGVSEDEAVYVYRFDSTGRTRVIADHNRGLGSAELVVSEPDSFGRRLALIHRIFPSPPTSSWKMMSYTIRRINQSGASDLLYSSQHDFWREENDPIFVLKPDQVIIERLDRGVGFFGTERRPNLIRFSFKDGVRRIQPMALQSQDFAEVWLVSSRVEMQPSSAPETQKWHEQLHADLAAVEYRNVVRCAAKPGRWSIGLDIIKKDVLKALRTYLLVRDLGNYRFEMEAVSDTEFKECPGEGAPSEKHPWLSVEQLKALP